MPVISDRNATSEALEPTQHGDLVVGPARVLDDIFESDPRG